MSTSSILRVINDVVFFGVSESTAETALTLAAQGGYEDLVRLLLERGAYIEHRDNKGYTPLINAAINGHREVVRLLLDRHAKLEEQSDRTKDTALSLACSGGRYEVAELLLQRCANKVSRPCHVLIVFIRSCSVL